MEQAQKKRLMVDVIEASLGRKATEENLQLIVRSIQNMSPDTDAIATTLKRLRMAIRLLIDEDLAEDVYQECRTIADA